MLVPVASAAASSDNEVLGGGEEGLADTAAVAAPKSAESAGSAERGKSEADDSSRKKEEKKEQKQDKSLLGKAGDKMKTTFNAFMVVSTVASLLLAAETLWELQGTPLTLSTAIPTLSKLLPLTGIGVFGAAQLVGLVARVIKVVVTLPIMLSGTWVVLQNAPQVGVGVFIIGLSR